MPTAGPADEAAIREQAYYLWEAEGRPDGRETEFWQRAVVAVTETSQLSTLTELPPKKSKKTLASNTKSAPSKAQPAKKSPKK